MRSLAPLLLLACVACSWSEPVPPSPAVPSPAAPSPAAPSPAAARGDTLAGIRSLVGQAACTDTAQCHTLAVGSKACGGPEYFLAWSGTATEPTALAALAERYRSERQTANAGLMGDCRVLPDPGAVCRAGRCVARPQGAADPS